MPVMIRNQKNGPTTFTDVASDVEIAWQGGEVRAVPDSLLSNVEFINALNQGVFVVETNEDQAQAEIRSRVEAAAEAKAARKAEVLSRIDSSADRVVARADIDEKGNITYKPADDDVLEIVLEDV